MVRNKRGRTESCKGGKNAPRRKNKTTTISWLQTCHKHASQHLLISPADCHPLLIVYIQAQSANQEQIFKLKVLRLLKLKLQETTLLTEKINKDALPA